MEAIAIIGCVVGVLGTIFAFVTLLRNKKTDDKTEGVQDGVVLTELGYIKKGIDGIEKRLERQENQYVDIVKHLAKVEESAKRAHLRIDKLEKYHMPN